MSDKPISYMPSSGLCYDPEDAKYWDESALALEVTRVFEVCHGCRMCFKFCDSFPRLFDYIDKSCDGDVKRLTKQQQDDIVDDCFQCKLCEVQCPYTPRDGHEYQLDFPKLIHRYQAIRHRKEGSDLRDKLLGDPDSAARAARLSFGMANVMNRVSIHRWFMEKILGIHRKKLLPDFATSTFSRWAERMGLTSKPHHSETTLFPTCYVENNEPQIGKDTVDVLTRNGVSVACARGLKCCGMPAWEHGDLDTLRKHAEHNIDTLMPYVEAGSKVLAINPTCAMMLRREYPELVAENKRESARKLAAAVQDPGEFLWSIRNEERFNTRFASSPGVKVGYHAPCHLRAQAVGFKGRDLLRKIPGVTPHMVMECCGHNGTYAMKTESFEASARIGQKAFEGMKDSQAEIWSTECPLAAIQFQQHTGVKPMHPMSILARAYRADGFRQALPETAKGEEA